jgi:hypothetical protein
MYYTTPEYPPTTRWTALKTDGSRDQLYEEVTQYLDRIASGLQCPPRVLSGKLSRIIGKWKLVKGMRDSIDYSCTNVIYDFRTDGTVIVNSDMAGFESGIYPYNYTVYDRLVDYLMSPFPNLIIDRTKVGCEVIKRYLILSKEFAIPYMYESNQLFVRVE